MSVTRVQLVGNVSTGASFAGIVTATSFSGNVTATSLVVSSGSTFTNGPILVGTATSTGTASQRLQVTGGAYVSSSVGIGTTSPTSKLHVIGDVRVTGVVTATSFVGSGANLTNLNIPASFNELDVALFS